MLLVKGFFQSAGIIEVHLEFQVKSEHRNTSDRSAINRFVSKFETSGSVNNKKGVISERRHNTRKYELIMGYKFIG